MKRFYVVDSDVIGTGKPETLIANQLGIYKLTSAGHVSQTTAPAATERALFMALGKHDADGFHDLGRIDLKSLQVVQTSYKAATPVDAIIAVATTADPIVNMDYSLFISRSDTVQDQRWRQTITYRAVVGDTWDTILSDMAKRINALKDKLGLTAVFTAAVGGATPAPANITITGTSINIIPLKFTAGDALHGAVNVVQTGFGIKAIGDVAYVKDELFAAAQTRGADVTYEDRYDLYGFLSNPLLGAQYDIFTFRFYNKRMGNKPTDEPLYQLLQLAVKSAGTVATRIKTVFASYIV